MTQPESEPIDTSVRDAMLEFAYDSVVTDEQAEILTTATFDERLAALDEITPTDDNSTSPGELGRIRLLRTMLGFEAVKKSAFSLLTEVPNSTEN